MAGSLSDVERVVKDISQTIVDNETYFGELDAVVGDGDFGFSLARGFEIVLAEWDTFDRTDPGTFLQKVAMTVSARIGGTSGPIWGTAMLRAGAQLKGSDAFTGEDVVRALRASVAGIQARGSAQLGEKTLLDALVPAIDALEAAVAAGSDAPSCMQSMATAAEQGAETTKTMQAMRGRASYTGERSIGSVDAGAQAIAVLAQHLVDTWPDN